jgi:hypothetical protein
MDHSWANSNKFKHCKTSALGGAGTQTAGIGFWWWILQDCFVAATEEYDGTSWTSVGNMNTARQGF